MIDLNSNFWCPRWSQSMRKHPVSTNEVLPQPAHLYDVANNETPGNHVTICNILFVLIKLYCIRPPFFFRNLGTTHFISGCNRGSKWRMFWRWSKPATFAITLITICLEPVRQLTSSEVVLKLLKLMKQAIQCDTNSTKHGALLMQNELLIAETETKYCQTKFQLLAIVYTLGKCHQCTLGQVMKTLSDYKPLDSTLRKTLASARK